MYDDLLDATLSSSDPVFSVFISSSNPKLGLSKHFHTESCYAPDREFTQLLVRVTLRYTINVVTVNGVCNLIFLTWKWLLI